MAKDLLHVTGQRERSEIASYLRKIAEKLEMGEPLSLSSGDQQVELQMPEYADFTVHVTEERTFRSKHGTTTLALDVTWSEDQDRPADFSIQ